MKVSPTDRTGISIGKPPACQTPRLTSSARVRKCAWQGLASLQVLRIAITGLPRKSSAAKPSCLARERWPKERRSFFANQREWNPQRRKFDAIPEGERPMVVVKRHPFERGKWTHVAFTWKGFNSARDDAVAKLYLNGDPQGELDGKRTFSWDLSKAAILIGVNYVGLYDDLAIFNRALGPDEIRELGRLDGGVGSLVPQRRPLR